MIISISGVPGSGKTSVGKLIAEQKGWPFYSIGGLRGKMALDRGITLDELNRLGETDPTTDTSVDDYARELGKKEDNFVIEGRLSWYFIPHAFKISSEIFTPLAVPVFGTVSLVGLVGSSTVSFFAVLSVLTVVGSGGLLLPQAAATERIETIAIAPTARACFMKSSNVACGCKPTHLPIVPAARRKAPASFAAEPCIGRAHNSAKSVALGDKLPRMPALLSKTKVLD